MASYNLNEALKKKAAPKKAAQQEIKLDDVSRVKVLSPGRQVFKATSAIPPQRWTAASPA